MAMGSNLKYRNLKFHVSLVSMIHEIPRVICPSEADVTADATSRRYRLNIA
jgi:hypothetical protein